MSLLDDDDLQVGTRVVVRSFWRRLAFGIMALVAASFIGGFVIFAGSLETAPREIASQSTADGIVALTGGTERLPVAFALLKADKGQRLLITGVGDGVTIDDLKPNFLPGEETAEDSAKISCCLDIDRAARDTVGNAGATVSWVKAQEYQSLIVVTSAYHMPRALIELGRGLPNTQLIPFPVQSSRVDLANWWKDLDTAGLVLGEYLRTSVAFVRAQANKLGVR